MPATAHPAMFSPFPTVVEAAAELPAGGAQEEGEPLGLHTQPPATADRLPAPGERRSARRGATTRLLLVTLALKPDIQFVSR